MLQTETENTVYTTNKQDVIDEVGISAVLEAGFQTGVGMVPCAATHYFPECTPQTHLVVYHVDFHGATSHMGIHVVNHGRNPMW